MSEEGMEKYGVQLDETKVKEASDSGRGPKTCPVCGAVLDGGGACATHGTEPFEANPWTAP